MPQPPKNVTIKSIAEEMGISFSTVSKALNNSSLVKEETRQAVLAKAREMGYAPNMLARGLRNRETKTIGVIFNDVENTVWTHMFKSISVEMAKYGYTTLIGDGQFSEKVERASILSFLSRLPDFVILSPATANTENLALLSGMLDRVIVMGQPIPGFQCHYVDVDYALGGYRSALALLESGHRQNLVFTVHPAFPISEQYLRGIRRAYEEFGVSLEEERLIFRETSIENGCRAILELWDDRNAAFRIPFTGVMTFCDLMAHGIYMGLRRLQKSVPGDVSVIGHDDNPLSEFSSPPLTTVHLPVEKMIECSLAIMKSTLLDYRKEIQHHRLEPSFIQRKSVRALEPGLEK